MFQLLGTLEEYIGVTVRSAALIRSRLLRLLSRKFITAMAILYLPRCIMHNMYLVLAYSQYHSSLNKFEKKIQIIRKRKISRVC